MPPRHPADIEKENAAAYDAIADSWDATRTRPWGEFDAFIAPLLRSGISILDAGCGNGRLVSWLDTQLDVYDYLGVDHSEKLLGKAQGHHPDHDFQLADLTTFQADRPFDLVVSIAVLHHLPRGARIAALRRLHASLVPGGRIVLTVWNLWQPRYLKHVVRSFLTRTPRECRIPYEHRVDRYVYAYTPAALRCDLISAGFRDVNTFFTDRSQRANVWTGRNIVATAIR